MEIETIKEILDHQNWEYTQVNQENILFFGLSGKNGKFQCYLELNNLEEKFSFVSTWFSDKTIDREYDILQLLNIINQSVFFGNFEMDWHSGEIRFKTNVFYQFIDLQPAWIEEIIMTNISTMDASLPAIGAIVHENKSIEESLNLIQFDDAMDDIQE